MGSNTSTVALQVIGRDKKRSLKYETVKYGRKSHGTQAQKWLHWWGPAAIVNDRSVLSSERMTNINKPVTDSNKNLVISPRWVLDTKTNWPTVSRNIRLDSTWYKIVYQCTNFWEIVLRGALAYILKCTFVWPPFHESIHGVQKLHFEGNINWRRWS
jgi:hypothetical protein